VRKHIIEEAVLRVECDSNELCKKAGLIPHTCFIIKTPALTKEKLHWFQLLNSLSPASVLDDNTQPELLVSDQQGR